MALLAYSQKYHSFRPGELWLDNNGVHINAHGGGFIFYNNKYYWFGEHKIEGEKGNYAGRGTIVIHLPIYITGMMKA